MMSRLRIEYSTQRKVCLKCLINFCLIITVPYTDTKDAEHRSCQRSWDGATGICRPLSECPDIRAEGASNVRPDLCELHGPMPIVCCVPKKRSSSEKHAQALSLSSFTKEVPLQEPLWRQKCREYSKLVYEEENPDSEPKVARCAQATRKSVRQATFGEFPHMVAIGFGSGCDSDGCFFAICGGSLISERYVLTAASCIVPDLGYSVLLATLFLNHTTDEDLKKHMIRISEVIPHPDYIFGRMQFDVGLALLKSSPTLGPYLRPACLHSGKPTSTLDLTVPGWGFGHNGNRTSDVLQKVYLLEKTLDECKAEFDDTIPDFLDGFYNDSMMCAGHSENKAAICQGDSGGPLQFVSSDFYCMYEVVGVVSFARPCIPSTPSTPGWPPLIFYIGAESDDVAVPRR